MSNHEVWEEGGHVYVRAKYKADKGGLAAAQQAEEFLASKGLRPIDVSVIGGTDVGRSIAKSAAGLGLLAATGFGFIGTSRRKAEFVVTYRSPNMEESFLRQLVDEAASGGLAADLRDATGGAATPPRRDPSAPAWAQEIGVSSEQIRRTREERRARRLAQRPGTCPAHPDREARRFTVEYPGRKAKRVWLCLEDVDKSVQMGATISPVA